MKTEDLITTISPVSPKVRFQDNSSKKTSLLDDSLSDSVSSSFSGGDGSISSDDDENLISVSICEKRDLSPLYKVQNSVLYKKTPSKTYEPVKAPSYFIHEKQKNCFKLTFDKRTDWFKQFETIFGYRSNNRKEIDDLATNFILEMKTKNDYSYDPEFFDNFQIEKIDPLIAKLSSTDQLGGPKRFKMLCKSLTVSNPDLLQNWSYLDTVNKYHPISGSESVNIVPLRQPNGVIPDVYQPIQSGGGALGKFFKNKESEKSFYACLSKMANNGLIILDDENTKGIDMTKYLNSMLQL
jgi:hypothetical protein